MTKTDWHAMDSAPKDRPVMTYVPGGMWSGGNPYLMAEWSEDMGVWLTCDDTAAVEPTHWCEMTPPEGAEPVID